VGKEPTGTGLSPEESAYYRAVEDHFARLRGTVFLVSPKDFELLRRWWREGVPLAAVLAGVAEVFERRRGEATDPVSSLAYCRHAVARHARRLAGGSAVRGPAAVADVPAELGRLTRATERAVGAWDGAAAVADVLRDLLRAIESLPGDADPAGLDETLGRLELAALESAAARLPTEVRRGIEATVEAQIRGLDVAGDVRERTLRALRLRAIRELLGLPRLELAPDGHG
jgi:hypothetical protein